jgi:branched-chain amino acid transport system ATP-binding protein
MSKAYLLEVKNLKKYFGGVKAVDDISFKVSRGEKIGIAGPNGAGKTTLINLISGYLLPTDGKIVYENKNIVNIPLIERVSMGIVRSWQLPQLFESFTIKEAIITSILVRKGKLYNIWKNVEALSDIIQEAIELSSLFSLGETKLVKELSEGERKLLDVALSFALQPKVLLLDEPTSGVSSEEKFDIMDNVLRIVSEKNITTLVIEHDLQILQKYFPRLMFMSEGKIIADGPAETVFKDERVREMLEG